MSRLNVLVVGASVAGPVTAYWLAKAGANVTVIERFPKLRNNGQGIDIRTCGVSVMRKMPGMEAAVRAKTTTMEGMSWSLVSEYEILRGDLSQILFDMTKDNERIKYVFGEQLASMQQNEKNDGPITVEFANGLSTSKFDLVVACDGAASRTRAIGLHCSVRDYMKPTNCWAAYFSMKEDLLKGSKVAQGFSAPGGRFMALQPDPSGMTRVLLMNVLPGNDPASTLPFHEASKLGDDALKEFIAERYRGGGWKFDEVMNGMMESDDFYGNELAQVKPPTLHRGRFVLVGDAGYAPGPTGGGTSLALAGAYVLAGEINKHQGDLEAGLQGYETTMRPIIDDLQKIPPFVFTFLAPQTTWGIWLRNNLFAFIAWTRLLEFAQRFFANAFASTDKFPLPDYEWLN